SYVAIMASMISFGVQLSVNRNVAFQKGWRSNYALAQASRMALSLFVIGFGVVSYLMQADITKIIFLAAPLIAWNGDYALYGNSKPVEAARLSFFRVAIPNAGLLLASYYLVAEAIYVYVLLVAVGIFIAGFFAARINGVEYLFPPKKSFYKIYLKYYKVGLYQLSTPFLVTGIIAIAKGYYEIGVIGLIYPVVKVYEVFKGGIRIVNQAFFRELKFDDIGMRVDKVGVIMALFFVIPTVFYPGVLLTLLDPDRYVDLEIIMVLYGMAMFICALKISADTRVLLRKKDNVNLLGYVGAAVIAIVFTIGFSYTNNLYIGIPAGVLSGEFFLLIVMGTSLGGMDFFLPRLRFLLKVSPVFAFAIIPRLFLSPDFFSMIASCGIYILLVLYVYRKLIFDASFLKRTKE
ncbi:MAG: hypothetical protein OEX02_18245, partial [Cyclobacteriaceae bacterium]|nr:hypothetical protein [Cyclobacteriaceae bacterium]